MRVGNSEEKSDSMGKKGEEVAETSFGFENEAYDGDTGDSKGSDGASNQQQTVSMKELFRFCQKREKFLILIGTIGAIFHGAAFPCMIIFYGQMTENFVQWSICDELTAQVNCKNYYSEFLGIKPDSFDEPEDHICQNAQFTFDIQFMDAGEDSDCPEGSVIKAGSEQDYFKPTNKDGQPYDYCFNTVDGHLNEKSVILSFVQTNPGNGHNVFRDGCTEAGWRNWVTRCNSCGYVDPEAAEDDKNKIRHGKCQQRYGFSSRKTSIPNYYSRADRPEAKLDPFPEADFGTVLCPSAVGANVQKVGAEFYGEQFCKGTNQNGEEKEWCTLEDLNLAISKYNGEVAFEELEYSIFTSLAGICIIFAIIATATVIAGYFQVMMYTKGRSPFVFEYFIHIHGS